MQMHGRLYYGPVIGRIYLFLRSVHLDEEVDDAKVLQGLPVADVLQLGILDTEIQHGCMRLKHLAYNLGGEGREWVGEWRGRKDRGEAGGGRGEGGGGRGERREGRARQCSTPTSLGFFFFSRRDPTRSSGFSSSYITQYNTVIIPVEKIHIHHPHVNLLHMTCS